MSLFADFVLWLLPLLLQVSTAPHGQKNEHKIFKKVIKKIASFHHYRGQLQQPNTKSGDWALLKERSEVNQVVGVAFLLLIRH